MARRLGACYKQLNAGVGQFGTDTLWRPPRRSASGSAGDDSVYARTDAALSALGDARDALAQKIKVDLDRAEFHGARLGRAHGRCGAGRLQRAPEHGGEARPMR